MKVNKKRKFLATVLLKTFEGEDNSQIISNFQDLDKELIEKYLSPTLKKDQTKDKNTAVLERKQDI